MDAVRIGGRAMKIALRIEKYRDGHEPDGRPDEVSERTTWHRLDDARTEITDPDEIAALEAGLAREDLA